MSREYWPGTMAIISEVEQTLLAAVQQRAARDTEEDAVAIGDSVAVACWARGEVHASLAEGLERYITDDPDPRMGRGGTFILDRAHREGKIR